MESTENQAVGTSFHGNYITSTVSNLKKAIGEPKFSPNDGADKVNFEWIMETNSGHVFTVYDQYKRAKFDWDI